MESIKTLQLIVTLWTTLLIISANGQSSSPCTGSMISSFTPCINFVTGSSNGGGPSASCCNSLQSILSASSQCACLIITANVPLPIIQSIANTLPQACNVGSLLQCPASGTPLPPSGRPFLLGPTPAPAIPSAAAAASAPAPSPLGD